MQKTAYRTIKTTADILYEPFLAEQIGRRESQLLLGEIFDVEAVDGLFLKGKSRHDGYKGYVHRDGLRMNEGKATHFCSTNLSFFRHAPDIKSREIMPVSFMSRLEIDKHSLKNGFVRACGHGWMPQGHVTPLSALRERIDYVSQALKLLGMPYRYGGRSALGMDCSGFVQTVMTRSGLARVPRDADMQEKSERLGPKINPAELEMGDIVFFPQHVGIMINPSNIISATEKTASVTIENIHALAERQGGISSVRRPVLLGAFPI